jgi:hypothetical protein
MTSDHAIDVATLRHATNASVALATGITASGTIVRPPKPAAIAITKLTVGSTTVAAPATNFCPGVRLGERSHDGLDGTIGMRSNKLMLQWSARWCWRFNSGSLDDWEIHGCGQERPTLPSRLMARLFRRGLERLVEHEDHQMEKRRERRTAFIRTIARYGLVALPGRETLELPAGVIQVVYFTTAHVEGRFVREPEQIRIRVTPVAGPPLVLERQRRRWRSVTQVNGTAWIPWGTIEVPSAGTYTVEATGTQLPSSDAPVLGFRAPRWFSGRGGWTTVAPETPLFPGLEGREPERMPTGPAVMASLSDGVPQELPAQPSATDLLAEITRLRDQGYISEKSFQKSKAALSQPAVEMGPTARARQMAWLETQRDRGRLSAEQFEMIKARLLNR